MDTYPNIWNFCYRGIKYGLLFGALLGALYGTVVFAVIIGTLYGFILGGGVGLLVGTAFGTVNWYVTRLVYPRLTHELYGVVLALCGGLFSGVCTFLAYSLLFHFRLNNLNPWYDVMRLAGFPAIIAAVAGIWTASRIASWYIKVVTQTA